MNAKKRAGMVLLLIGVVVLILSLIADVVGLGGHPGMGKQQVLGIVVGVVVAVIGLLLKGGKAAAE